MSTRRVEDAALSDDDEEELIAANSTKPRTRRKRRMFLPQSAAPPPNRSDPSMDYQNKYPADDPGMEMSAGARVWRVYLDEAEMFDNEMIQQYMDTIDIILVFGGLFSAVVTTFVVESSHSLKPDYAQISASLLTEMVLLQRAMLQSSLSGPTSLPDIPMSELHFNSSTTETLDPIITALWYTSLTFSLSVALFAILVKQWLHQYSAVRGGTLRDRALARQTRYDNLFRWGVPVIIGVLPVLLHVALLLFFTGLVLFISELQLPMISTVVPVAGFAYLAYFTSIALPIIFPDCPYQTPVSTYVQSTFNFLGRLFRRLTALGIFQASDASPAAPAQGEHRHNLIVESLLWLYDRGSNPTCRIIVAQASAASPPSEVIKFLPDLGVRRKLFSGTAARALQRAYARDGPVHLASLTPYDETLLRALVAQEKEVHPLEGVPLEALQLDGMEMEMRTLSTAVRIPSVQSALVADWGILELSCPISEDDKETITRMSFITGFLEAAVLSTSALPPSIWLNLIRKVAAQLRRYRKRRLDGERIDPAEPDLIALSMLVLSFHGTQTNDGINADGRNWYDSPALNLADMCASDGYFNAMVQDVAHMLLMRDSSTAANYSSRHDPMTFTLHCITHLCERYLPSTPQAASPLRSHLGPVCELLDNLLCELLPHVLKCPIDVREGHLKRLWVIFTSIQTATQPIWYAGRSSIMFAAHFEAMDNSDAAVAALVKYSIAKIDLMTSVELPAVSGAEGSHFLHEIATRYNHRVCQALGWDDTPTISDWLGMLLTLFKLHRTYRSISSDIALSAEFLKVILRNCPPLRGSNGELTAQIIGQYLFGAFHPSSPAESSNHELWTSETLAWLIQSHLKQNRSYDFRHLLRTIAQCAGKDETIWRNCLKQVVGWLREQVLPDPGMVMTKKDGKHLRQRMNAAYDALQEFAMEILEMRFDEDVLLSLRQTTAKNSHVERSPRRQETDDGFSFSPFGPPRFSDTCSLRAEAKQDEDASITDDNGTSVGLAETTATPTSYTTGPGLLRKLFPSIGHRKQRSQV